MNLQSTTVMWLDGDDVCQVEHLAEISGLSLDEIEDLIDNEVIAPVDPAQSPRMFALQGVTTARMARRLRDDFLLDRHGLTLALKLLQRVAQLEAELQALRARAGLA
ncbi:chaperone modulator CbpM [Pandoraea sp.]|uniref:chaperone modulator CbpM n=1 Tax=Pandoraea sp. TaxID=1883445 RepID=UPI0011FC6F46|nr:chaperone modulator CbpM [Pandoraea sp.]TAL53185.1 MAG: hypothetical protein EPN80_16395 [Pandoraea sp.]TAM20607.1 MAG: hypothetical protein EPN65_00340 [Pandoraea sp.]